MTQLSLNRSRDMGRLSLIVSLGCSLLLFAATDAAAQKRGAKPKPAPSQQLSLPSSPDQLLKLGFFYYNNDDISDKAAEQFNAVIAKFPNTPEAETAQYYLGSYYQRKFYVQKSKSGKSDTTALLSAKAGYSTYTKNYYGNGSHQWLADAFFNLALVLAQLEDLKVKDPRTTALYELNKMRQSASLDNSVYIYTVIYSQSPADVLDGYFPTEPLGSYASSLLSQSFDRQVAAIKDWCRQQGGKR